MVDRADHVGGGNAGEQDHEHAGEGVEQRAHGAHGKGDEREQRVDPPHPEPDVTKGTEAMRGGAGWGDEGSGGSNIDKRPPAGKK